MPVVQDDLYPWCLDTGWHLARSLDSCHFPILLYHMASMVERFRWPTMYVVHARNKNLVQRRPRVSHILHINGAKADKYNCWLEGLKSTCYTLSLCKSPKKAKKGLIKSKNFLISYVNSTLSYRISRYMNICNQIFSQNEN
jgi:hypothetical protein